MHTPCECSSQPFFDWRAAVWFQLIRLSQRPIHRRLEESTGETLDMAKCSYAFQCLKKVTSFFQGAQSLWLYQVLPAYHFLSSLASSNLYADLALIGYSTRAQPSSLDFWQRLHIQLAYVAHYATFSQYRLFRPKRDTFLWQGFLPFALIDHRCLQLLVFQFLRV